MRPNKPKAPSRGRFSPVSWELIATSLSTFHGCTSVLCFSTVNPNMMQPNMETWCSSNHQIESTRSTSSPAKLQNSLPGSGCSSSASSTSPSRRPLHIQYTYTHSVGEGSRVEEGRKLTIPVEVTSADNHSPRVFIQVSKNMWGCGREPG